MRKLKKQNGTTLITLIITIIVMLILLGTSVNIALNGGIINVAKKAVEQTQIANEKEELLIVAISTVDSDGKVDFSKMENNLPNDFEKIKNKIYKSKVSEKTYIVSDYGEVTILEETKIIINWNYGKYISAVDGTLTDDTMFSSSNEIQLLEENTYYAHQFDGCTYKRTSILL